MDTAKGMGCARTHVIYLEIYTCCYGRLMQCRTAVKSADDPSPRTMTRAAGVLASGVRVPSRRDPAVADELKLTQHRITTYLRCIDEASCAT